MTDIETSEDARTPEPDHRDETQARMQAQIDDLAATLRSHQRIFEAMFASGQLPPDIDR